MHAPRNFCFAVIPLCAFAVVFSAAFAQVPGPNINIVANDPFNQKQVEVDAGANPANPSHIFAGFIDYQTVVNENPLAEPNSSAWCGYSYSTNNGKTWKNALVPGVPGDTSPAGLSSPIHGQDQCGDPAVAWDTNGHVFLVGLTQGPRGAILFAARYTDPDDGSGTLNYDFTVALATGNPSANGQDIDKPSVLFVPDRTPGGSATAPGTLYACGTVFDGSVGGKFRNKVVCAISNDGGSTYTKASQGKINGNVNTNNGTAMAQSPDGAAYVFWRAFLGSENGYWFSKVDRFGNASAPVLAIGGSGFYPYDAPSLPDLARTNAFPSIATDASGSILLAFQAYSDTNGFMGAPSSLNTPRVFVTYSTNAGASWSQPRAADYGPAGGNAFQFMPRIALGGGGLISILYYDARNDGRQINATPQGYLPNGNDRRFDVRLIQGHLSSGVLTYNPLGSFQVNQDKISALTGSIVDRSPKCGPAGCPSYLMPNLKIAGGGTVPFIGDYIALVPAVSLVRNPVSSSLPRWRLADQPGDPTTFHAFFASTRDVGFPFNQALGYNDINGDWTQFVPLGLSQQCVNPKTRDSNIYYSSIGPGVFANWSGTSRPLTSGATSIPPSFVVTVQNLSGSDLPFRLTIQNPAGATGSATASCPGGLTETWSFVQTPATGAIPALQLTVDTPILNNSSISFPVYYRFRDSCVNSPPVAPVQVSVQQIDSIGGGVTAGGQSTSVIYSTSAASLDVSASQIFNLQLTNQATDLKVQSVQSSNVSPSNIQLKNIQLKNIQLKNIQLKNAPPSDQDATLTVSGTGSTATPSTVSFSLANGQDLLNAGYQFQLLIYQTQLNPDVGLDPNSATGYACAATFTPTDVVLSNIAIVNSAVINQQVNNTQPLNIQLKNSAISDPQASNATFVVSSQEKVNVTLRSFKPDGASVSYTPDSTNVSQADQSQAVNPDGTQPSAFYDFSPPAISYTVTDSAGNVVPACPPPTPGVTCLTSGGLYTGAVTVTWNAIDPGSGIQSTTGCGPVTVSSGTRTLTCSATNGVNLTASKTVTIQIDSTPPVITYQITGTPGSNGWYTSNVTVTWTITAASGIASTTAQCGATTTDASGKVTGIYVLTAETTGTALTCSATSNANLTGSATTPAIKIDKTPPVIPPATVQGTLGNNGWYVSNVSVSWAPVDNISGIASNSGCAASTWTTDTVGVTLTCSATNGAGLSASNSVTFKRDATPPMIGITAPANNGSYLLNATVASSYTCTDATSLIAPAPNGCSGTVANGSNINTSTVASNAQTFTVNAVDNAGNTATLTNSYFVMYGFTVAPPKSQAKLGSVVPLSWQLKDAKGVVITTTSSLVKLTAIRNLSQPSGACPAVFDAGSAAAIYNPLAGWAGKSGIQFITSTGQFQVNWDTSNVQATPPFGAGCYTIVIQLLDDSGPAAKGYPYLDVNRLHLTSVRLN